MFSIESLVFCVFCLVLPAVYAEGENLDIHYKHPDIEAQMQKNLIIGVVVGCGLAAVFLVILCITYNYYKHKPYRNVPRDADV